MWACSMSSNEPWVDCKADLVAVIDGRRAGVAHLHEDGEQQAALGFGDLGRVFGVFVPAKLVQRARCVVG